MLTVSPLRSTKYGNQGAMESFSIGNCDFADLSDGNLLESINFDDLFVGFNVDGDVLPDLEMDSDMLAEFSVSCGEESEMNSSASVENNTKAEDKSLKKKIDEDKTTSSSHGSGSSLGEEIVSKRDESVVSKRDESKGRKSSSQTKNQQGKRKVKVDWTPELHRRFVQAVEQLGVDKAVPSRILEIMGIDCLTRHNIASHLQKYRSHRKHLLAREAEAASWNQRRQLYGVTATGGGVGGKREVSPWPAAVAPTMGFPPMTTMHHFRPLHVWGHPSMPMWPKHAPHSQPPPPPQPLHWAPAATPQPPQDPALWHSQHQRPPSAIISAGAACFPQPRTTARFGCPPVPGIPPQTMYKAADHGIGAPGPLPGPFFDFHPSKESIDAAIGDVLSKPWLPLPLGLKAPALDSVMGELHKQGISNIPPSCA